jgi:hypothetical protein
MLSGIGASCDSGPTCRPGWLPRSGGVFAIGRDRSPRIGLRREPARRAPRACRRGSTQPSTRRAGTTCRGGRSTSRPHLNPVAPARSGGARRTR